MNKYEIIKRIEDFAPLETMESWDCSGFVVETSKDEISKIMLCLTPTTDILNQAESQNCDMIISHHPMFFVPMSFKNIDIYCAHTNLDKANGGTTDTLISKLGLADYLYDYETVRIENDFVRIVKLPNPVLIADFGEKLKQISPNMRYANNKKIKHIQKIGFCSGSGSEFIKYAQDKGCDAFVTGDMKFHTALDSEIVVFDIGHFESEIIVLPVFEKLLLNTVEIVYAEEKSPFQTEFT